MTDMMTVRSDTLREQYTQIRHKSGLTVYVFPKDLSTAYALIATRFGSTDNCFRVGHEGDFITIPDGVAHFLEHKLFENEDGEDTFTKFARTGANANAYTGFRTTAYLFSCTEDVYPSLEILLRSVYSPHFTPENVQKEQGIIAQEIRMGEDEPYHVLQYGMLKGLYESHSVRVDIAGTVPSIMTITPDILYLCHRAFYHPSHMALCVCGRVEADKVMSIVDEILTETEPLTVECRYAEEAPCAFRPRVTHHMPVAKPLFCIGVKDTDISPDPYVRLKKELAMNFIASMVFGKSSDFYNTMADEGLLSPHFDVWFYHNTAFSFFSLSGDCDDPEAVFRRFADYVASHLDDALCEESFTRCRRAIYADYVKGFDSTEEIANSLITDYALVGTEIFACGELIRQLDLPYVRAVAHALFRPEAFTLSTVLPISE